MYHFRHLKVSINCVPLIKHTGIVYTLISQKIKSMKRSTSWVVNIKHAQCFLEYRTHPCSILYVS